MFQRLWSGYNNFLVNNTIILFLCKVLHTEGVYCCMKVRYYLSLVKFSHTLFAMPFAMIGYTLAIHHHTSFIEWRKLFFVILCMIFARNAAMAFNRYLDRDIDALNPRTAAAREIPRGIISPKEALLFTLVNILLFVGTTYFINQLCFYLSPVALLVILGYSYTKRFTALCHFILGIGLALAPIGAYLAVRGEWHYLPLLFGLIVITWVSGFDIIYALQDEEFDKTHHLYSIPSMLGKKNAIHIARILHLITSVLIILTGLIANFNYFYWAGSMLFITLLIYQHLQVKPHDLSKINIAFFTANGTASVIYGFFVIISILFSA